MKLNELIETLVAIQADYGDIECWFAMYTKSEYPDTNWLDSACVLERKWANGKRENECMINWYDHYIDKHVQSVKRYDTKGKIMKYKYNDTVFLIGYGHVKIIAVNTNESYSNLTTYDLKDVLEDGLNTFYSVCAERIERIINENI